MSFRPTRMEVRLDNIRANYRAIMNHIRPDGRPGKEPRVFAVLKANAYNLGAVPVAWAVKQEGADYFIVATADEALELRAGGITDPVLVLGASPTKPRELVRHEIRSALTDLEMARHLSKAAVAQGKRPMSTSK